MQTVQKNRLTGNNDRSVASNPGTLKLPASDVWLPELNVWLPELDPFNSDFQPAKLDNLEFPGLDATDRHIQHNTRYTVFRRSCDLTDISDRYWRIFYSFLPYDDREGGEDDRR